MNMSSGSNMACDCPSDYIVSICVVVVVVVVVVFLSK